MLVINCSSTSVSTSIKTDILAIFRSEAFSVMWRNVTSEDLKYRAQKAGKAP